MRRSERALVALVLLLAAAPAAAAQELSSLADAEAGRVAGDLARAIALLEPLAAQRPRDPDILRRLGVSYAAAGRHGEAIAMLERASALAPADRDIALALARARLWSGDRAGARRDAVAVSASDPANVELPELFDSIARAGVVSGRGPSLSLSLGASTVDLDARSKQRWLESVAAASVPIGERTSLSAEVEHIDRERAADTRLIARLDQRLAGGASLWASATATPSASFREHWSLRGGGELPLIPNLTLLLNVRHADYRTTSVTGVEPGLRVQWDQGRWAAHAWSINLFENGRHRSGWSGRIERALPGEGLLFAGAATYPDTEAGITRRVRGGYLGLALPISSALTLRVTADGEQRAQSYERYGLTVGMTLRRVR
jgi:YaiO family outer membrane protein